MKIGELVEVTEVWDRLHGVMPRSVSVVGGDLEICLPPGSAPRSGMGCKISLNGKQLDNVRRLTLFLGADEVCRAEIDLCI